MRQLKLFLAQVLLILGLCDEHENIQLDLGNEIF